jgi:hypothetical protein
VVEQHEPLLVLVPEVTLTTARSLTHCQNSVCVVQNCLPSRQSTSAVRFFLVFSFFALTLVRPRKSATRRL